MEYSFFDHTVIIIPTYNEALNVQLMLDSLFGLCPNVSVLIIDDNSPDKTYAIVEMIKFKYPKLYLIKRPLKSGLGTAYDEGFKWALAKKFKYIIQMDCDFSHNPEDVRKLIETLIDKKADLVIGSRFLEKKTQNHQWSSKRKYFSSFASTMLRILSGANINDITGGFKCFSRETLEKILKDELKSKGFIFQFETNYKAHNLGLKIIEIPIMFNQRRFGNSKMSLSIILESILIFFRLKFA